jgi:hypothetical protein
MTGVVPDRAGLRGTRDIAVPGWRTPNGDAESLWWICGMLG